MKKVFISYSAPNEPFVKLLKKLLDFHRQKAWCAGTNLMGGERFPEQIQEALRDADVLLVVVGRDTLKSRWVTREVAAFQAQKPDGPVIPLLVDHADVSVLPGELKDYQAIDFSNQVAGMEQLFSALGTTFLSQAQLAERRKNPKDRRRKGDRRHRDRRLANVVVRMRTGLWLSYAKRTGKGEFEQFEPRCSPEGALRRMEDALLHEACRWEYRDRENRVVEPVHVLRFAIHSVWEKVRNNPSVPNVYLTDEVADLICASYALRMKDRRNGDRRWKLERRAVA